MGHKTITTVYLPIRQKDWIQERGYQLSPFIRGAVQEKIEKMEGFKGEIRQIKQELEKVTKRKEELEEKLEELEEKDKEWVIEEERKELDSLLTSAIINIDYEGWEDAFDDLKDGRGRLSIEEFRHMVREKWDEINE